MKLILKRASTALLVMLLVAVVVCVIATLMFVHVGVLGSVLFLLALVFFVMRLVKGKTNVRH